MYQSSLKAIVLTFVGFTVGMVVARSTIPKTFIESIPVLLTPASPSPVPSPLPKTTIIFTGDVMVGRGVNIRSLAHQDFTWPFAYVGDFLKSADITVVNLETPIVADCPTYEHGFIFCAPPETVAGLTYAGVDVASLANNHSSNFGWEGVSSSEKYLTEAGIGVIGLNKPFMITRDGIRFAFLGYNDIGNLQTVAKADPETIKSEIAAARQDADVVIVFFHWGEEYRREPTTRQVNLAHSTIDAGADVIIGAHPHWVETKELYQGKPIYYSLGNFVFDQEWSQETKEGLAVKLTYSGRLLEGIEEIPVLIQDYGQPHLMDSQAKSDFFRKIGY